MPVVALVLRRALPGIDIEIGDGERGMGERQGRAGAIGASQQDSLAPPVNPQIAAGIHEATHATSRAQRLDGAVDGVALGDSAEVERQPHPAHCRARFHSRRREREIGEPARL